MNRKRFALIGYPLAHSRSALLYNKIFSELKLAAVYENRELPPEDVANFFREEIHSYDGLNITIPYKTRAFDYVSVHCQKKTGGALNCLLRRQGKYFGYNTDIMGIARSLQDFPLEKRSVLVFGAGGAARALFSFFEGKNISGLKVVGRNLPKVLAVLEDFSLNNFQIISWKIEMISAAIEQADLLINATPLGMLDYAENWQLPEKINLHGKLCFDLVYNPQKTQFLCWAEKNGAETKNGLVMFLEQAACNLELFLGLKVKVALLKKYYQQLTEGK